jgi:alpha-tubulin suppressor-like RCC1 family protein
VFLAGSKLHGKLAKNSDTKPLTTFKLLPMLVQVKMVACNDYTTLCLLQDASLVQINGSHDYEPKLITSLSGIVITEISCGEHHSVALD